MLIAPAESRLTRFRHEGIEVQSTGGFSHFRARKRTLRYVGTSRTAREGGPAGGGGPRRGQRGLEHPEMRKHGWVLYIVVRSRQLVRYAG